MHGWSALVLAGGAGRRFGGGKLLADLAGAPVIRRVTEAVAGSGFVEVIVVTGAEDAPVRAALEGSQIEIESADLVMEPTTTVEVGEGDARTLLRLIEALDDHDDVDAVHANFEMSEAVLEKALA